MDKDLQRLSIIFTADDMNRITVSEDGLLVDLHGKSRHEAMVFINNIINLINHPFVLDVIHGYNRGTVLKQMLRKEKINSRIVSRKGSNYNMGETFLMVA